jgi:glycosyltransferase involved in cell wall biosynthesis
MTTSGAPLVTIGVPVWNGETYLAACLESALAQTMTDLEIVVADNASSDQTPAIVRRYAARDPRIRYVRHRENIGLAANFSALVELSRARYFRWLAADDLIAPPLIERSLDVLDQHPSVMVVATRLEVIDSHGQAFRPDAANRRLVSDEGGDVPIRESIAEALGDPDPVRRFQALLRGMLGLEISTYTFGLMRSEILRRTPLLGSYPGSDKVLLAELALGGPFRQIPEVLWSCRIHPTHVGGGTAADVQRAMRPGRRARVGAMRSGQLAGYVAAIGRAPPGVGAKAACLAAVLDRGLTSLRGGGE